MEDERYRPCRNGRYRVGAFAFIAGSTCAFPSFGQVPGELDRAGAPDRSFVTALVTERLRDTPDTDPLPDSAALERATFLDPEALYPTPLPYDPNQVDPAWRRALETLTSSSPGMAIGQTQRWYRWELGLARAMPSLDVPVISGRAPFETPWVVANIVKAGVDLDIATRARELMGERDAALAATLAVAVQLLREQGEVARSLGNNYAGHWSDPLERFMTAGSLDALGDEHVSYLLRGLENELSSWRERRRLSTYRLPLLPVAARVARVAAAYRALQYSVSPCHADGSPDLLASAPLSPDGDRPLCFVAMTDRRVVQWFVATLLDDLAAHEASPDADSAAMRRMVAAVGRVQPGWLGVFSSAARTSALDTRVIAAGIGRELVARGRIRETTMQRLDESAVDQLCHGATP